MFVKFTNLQQDEALGGKQKIYYKPENFHFVYTMETFYELRRQLARARKLQF